MRFLPITSWTWLAAAGLFLFTLTSPDLHGAGVAAFKEQPFHSDDLATIVVYSKIRETALSYHLDLGTKEIALDRSKIVAFVTVPELPADIRDESGTDKLRQTFAELSAFAAKYQKAIPILKPHAEQFKAAIARRVDGDVRYEGKWISGEEFADIQRKEMAALEAARQREEEREKEIQAAKEREKAFYAEQRSKGLELYGDKWLPRAQVHALQKRDAEMRHVAEIVDERSLINVEYMSLATTPEGILIQPRGEQARQAGMNLGLAFLEGSFQNSVAEGDSFRGNLFWCGTRTFDLKNGTATIHSYKLNYADSLEQVRESLYPGDKPAAKQGPRPEVVKSAPQPPEDDIPALLRDYNGFGSGFFIGTEGYFVTNAHVVGEASVVDIYHADKKVPAKVLHVSKVADLAVLKADIAVTGLLLAADDAEPGTDIYVVGFPRPTMQGIDVKVTKGIVSSTRDGTDESRFQIDAAIQPGNSGGALCDDSGRVTGVAVAMLDPLFVMAQTGSLPQNVNYAIKTSELVAFLRSKSIMFQLAGTADSETPKGNGVKRVCAASGLVLVKE